MEHGDGFTIHCYLGNRLYLDVTVEPKYTGNAPGSTSTKDAEPINLACIWFWKDLGSLCVLSSQFLCMFPFLQELIQPLHIPQG